MRSFVARTARSASVLVAVALSTASLYAGPAPTTHPSLAPERGEWSIQLGGDVGGELDTPGARAVEIVRPAGKAPARGLRLRGVPVKGGVADFSLTAFDVFTDDARIVAMRDGVEVPLPRPTATLYRGRSSDGRGDVFLAVDGAACQAVVTYGGETSLILPTAGGARHVLAAAAAMPRPAPAPSEYCGADVIRENQERLAHWSEARAASASKTLNPGLLQTDVMLDVNNSLYTSVFGSSTTATTNYVTSLIGAASAIYERDVNVRLKISMLTIWTTPDPFTGASSSAQLNSYVTWARANRANVTRDIGHLLLNGNVTNYGGIAYIDVLCDSNFGYGLGNIYGHATFPTPSYYWDMDCVTHEIGHNFGSPHTHCYSPPIDMCYNAESGCYNGPVIPVNGTIMSYCHLTAAGKTLRFSQREIDVVRGGATSATCLAAVAEVPFDTVGVYSGSSGAFFLRNVHAGGVADVTATYGPAGLGWMPLAGDWDGNGTDTIGLYDPTTGFFYLKNSNAPGNADIVFSFGPGGSAYKPVVGDWNGDGVDTVGVYSTTTGTFFLRNALSPGPADLVFSFGPPNLQPLAGDWNGDGIDTVGVYSQTSGAFFLRNYHASGVADVTLSFGAGGAGYVPVAGDWNGDSLSTIGLYQPSTGVFFLRNTNANGSADLTYTFGPAHLTPIVGNWDAQ
jgi:hypothetical protein